MMSWYEFRRRHPLFRKGVSLSKQVPRAVRRWAGRGDRSAAVLANSIPKSGTHLLVQILESFPGVRNYDTIITSLPALRYRVRSDAGVCRKLDRVAPGELFSGHLYCRESYVRKFAQRNIAPFFIYRDPRDIAVSEALYLTRMTRWHRLHRHYARVLRTDEQRIRFSIAGAVNVAGVDYGDIGERCRPFLGWIGRDDVCAVRYEDLVGEGRGEQIARMIRFYAARTGLDDDLEGLLMRAEANIDPARSRTFRRGAAGGWADLFTDEHRDIFKQKAGGLLVELGYEQDENW